MFRILNSYNKSIIGCAVAAGLLVALHGAKAANFEVLFSFQHGNDGGNPRGALIADKAGNLYGTTSGGGSGQGCGPNGCGVIFKLAPDGTLKVLYSFGGPYDAYQPWAGVIADKTGNLYGTTDVGGSYERGTVFKLAPDGTETVLHAFAGGRDGDNPAAGLLLRDGKLYGTTEGGGRTRCNCGTVFRVALDGRETVLHHFSGTLGDGEFPAAGLVADSAGDLYGTTTYGGGSGCSDNYCGTVFKLAPDRTETVLYGFSGGDGSEPHGGVIADKAGNLYGTTYVGGSHGDGTVFKLAPAGTETVLYDFRDSSDGGDPYAGVIADKAGNLYGTTVNGGSGTGCYGLGCGTVFKLAPDGTYSVLHTFTGGSDGADPYAGLLLRKGYLYGTTLAGAGGPCSGDYLGGCGTVFRVKL